MEFETTPGKIIGFLSDHFDLIIAVNGAILLSFVGVWILLKIRDVTFRTAFYETSKSLLYSVFVATQIFLFALYGRLYWENYKKPAPVLHLDENVLADTKWVRDDTRIYFIDENKLRSIRINNTGLEDVFEGDAPVKRLSGKSDHGRFIVDCRLHFLGSFDLDHLDTRHPDGAVIDIPMVPGNNTFGHGRHHQCRRLSPGRQDTVNPDPVASQQHDVFSWD